MTPHISAAKEEIAKTVIMPGDPLRAKYIAENFLTEYKLVNTIRNMYAYTGFYKGKQVTIMGSGIGIPSMGLYSYELYKFYDVENIIRVGTAGSYSEDLKLFDVILVDSSYSESSYAKMQNNSDDKILFASKNLNDRIKKVVAKHSETLKECRVSSIETFYNETEIPQEMVAKNCLAVEMETFALFQNAKYLNRQAACLLTISDNLVTNEIVTPFEREQKVNRMIEIALETL